MKIHGIFATLLVLVDSLGGPRASLYLATSQVKRSTPAAVLLSLGQSYQAAGPLELGLRFSSQVRPKSVGAVDQMEAGQCGHWFLEASSDHPEGFPWPSGCRWNLSIPEIALSFTSGSWLARSCSERCSYQFVLLLELALDLMEGDQVAEILATENDLEIFSTPVIAMSATRPGLRGQLSMTLTPAFSPTSSTPLAPLATEQNATQITLEVRDAGNIGEEVQDAIHNISEVVLHLALLPFSAWDVTTCEAEGRCQVKGMGLYRSALEIQLNRSDLEMLPVNYELILPALMTGFFPTSPVAEVLVFGEDINETSLEYAALISCNQLWKPIDPSAATFAILSSDRSGFGPTPFVASKNHILLHLLVPAVLSNMEGLNDVGLTLILPSDFECLNITDETGTGNAWAQRGVRPWECYRTLAPVENLYQDQVLSLNVTFRATGGTSATAAGGTTRAPWQLLLRSRGALTEASEPFVMTIVTHVPEKDEPCLPSSQEWLESIRVLEMLQQVVLQPSSLSFAASNWLSITFRMGTSNHVRRVVLDAPSAFDFDNCATRRLNPARYDRQRGDQQLNAPGDVRCVADVWPCVGRLTASSLCSELSGPKNRAHLLQDEVWKASLLYGLEVSVRNPSSPVPDTSFYLFTWDDEGPVASQIMTFNPDRPAETWQLYQELLQVTMSLQDLRPFHHHGVPSVLSVSFMSTESRSSNLCITAPSGYVWGPPVSMGLLSRNCWAVPDSSPLTPICRAVDNDIRWNQILVTAAVALTLALELQLPERLPLLGANAFFVQLDFTNHWAAAAVDVNSGAQEPFLIQAISDASVSCSCSVVGYEANYLTLSARLPQMQGGWRLRVTGDSDTSGFTFPSNCAMRTPVDLASGVEGFPNGTRCMVSTRETNGEATQPQLLVEAMTSWPRGIYAMEVMAKNPAEVKVGTWTFDIIDATESPVVLPISAVGCPIRRRMSAAILPVEPFSTMAMVLKSDGRPGYRNYILLQLVLSDRPNPLLQLQLRVAASRGFSFMGCDVKMLDAEEMKLVPSAAWPGHLGTCSAQHQTPHVAEILLPSGMEAQTTYVLKLGMDNPSIREASVAKQFWYFELGDEASLPVLGPNFQLLRHVSLEPFSMAAGGTPAPMKIHFEPSSRESRRLVVSAPMNFKFMGSCSFLEMGGPCEQCTLSRGWCAMTSECGTDDGTCPKEYFSIAVAERMESSGVGSFDADPLRRACHFQLRPSDLSCRMEGPGEHRLILELLHGMRMVQGRRYTLQVSVANPRMELIQDQTWQLQTEVFHQGLWISLDLGEAAQYPVVPAIPWAVHVAATATLPLRRGEFCQAALADGDVKVVTFEIALPERNASDIFEVQLPQGGQQ